MKELIYKRRKYLLFLTVVFLISLSCDKIDSQIPDVRVNFEINLNFFDLQIPGTSEYFENEGFGGVIVSHLSEGEFYAYDAACTNEVSTGCHVVPEGLIGTCSCCESQYTIIYSGNPVSGPAPAPLKQYKTSLIGTTLRVYN